MSSDTDHKQKYKNVGLDIQVMRKRREEEGIQLRKVKREEEIIKRRNIKDVNMVVDPVGEPSESHCLPTNLAVSTVGISAETILALYNADVKMQLNAIEVIRKLLSNTTNPQIHEVINAGILPRIIEFLKGNHTVLQFEAAWILTNIASGTSAQTQSLCESGACEVFIQLLSSGSPNVKEQSVWALGNIAGDSTFFRDHLLKFGILPLLLKLLEESKELSMLRNVVWVISNLCRGNDPWVQFENIYNVLAPMTSFLYHNDILIVSDVCNAFYNLSRNSGNIPDIFNCGIHTRLIELLAREFRQAPPVALKILGNMIASPNNIFTDEIIKAGIVPYLLQLLHSDKAETINETAWVISNIMVANNRHIAILIENNIFAPLVDILKTGKFKNIRETIFAIQNLTIIGTPEQKQHLVDLGGIPVICDLLSSSDSEIMFSALNSIECLLQPCDNDNGTSKKSAIILEECGGLDKLECMNDGDNNEIWERLIVIFKTYFSDRYSSSSSVEDLSPGPAFSNCHVSSPAMDDTYQF